MIFNQNKKLSEVLEKALEMKRNGKNVADIAKMHPEFSDELKSLLSTAEIVEKEKDDVQPSEAVLRGILTQLDDVTEKDGVRYSFIEKAVGFPMKNVLLNFNQVFMSKKAYVGAAAGVFLLALIVGVGWYSLPGAKNGDPLLSLQKSEDELSAEIDYLASLGVDPFIDLDGDLQNIIDLSDEAGDGASKASSAPVSLDSNMKELEASFDDFQKSLSELNVLGEGKSLNEVDDTLSSIDQSY